MMFLPPSVEMLLDKLNQSSFEAYVVGGCVRDMLMGTSVHDYDITTSATPEEVKQVFAMYRVIETGIQHGTVTVLVENEPYEITTFRVESAYSDSRHPDSVQFTRSLTDDLSRRDFTVNAMAYNPIVGLIDPFKGQQDIENGILRCVGNAKERFSEDALRILRLLRFSSVLGFAIEEETEKAAFLLKDKLTFVSEERVAVELCKLLCGKKAGDVIERYVEILGVPIPELLPMAGFDQKNHHHIYDVLRHTAVAVDAIAPKKELRLAALFHDIGKPSTFSMDEKGVGHFYSHAAKSEEMCDAILARLKFDNATRMVVTRLVKWHDMPIECNEKSVKRTLGKMTPEFFFSLIALKRADNLAQSPAFRDRQVYYDELEALAKDILARQECFSLKDLAVNGRDLIALGIKEGKEVGLLLCRLLDDVICERIPNQKEALLRQALSYGEHNDGNQNNT